MKRGALDKTVSRHSLEEQIVESTRRVIAHAILYSHQVAERLGLGASDAQFMTLLEVHGPLTPGQLAELTGLKTGTVTGVLDRLEQARFVRRDRDPDDRRKVIVSRNEEEIEKRVRPQYAPQAEGMVTMLREYDEEQLSLIAEFLARVSGRR
jgi:DNA-binding MarR family transcriptional regulator